MALLTEVGTLLCVAGLWLKSLFPFFFLTFTWKNPTFLKTLNQYCLFTTLCSGCSDLLTIQSFSFSTVQLLLSIHTRDKPRKGHAKWLKSRCCGVGPETAPSMLGCPGNDRVQCLHGNQEPLQNFPLFWSAIKKCVLIQLTVGPHYDKEFAGWPGCWSCRAMALWATPAPCPALGCLYWQNLWGWQWHWQCQHVGLTPLPWPPQASLCSATQTLTLGCPPACLRGANADLWGWVYVKNSHCAWRNESYIVFSLSCCAAIFFILSLIKCLSAAAWAALYSPVSSYVVCFTVFPNYCMRTSRWILGVNTAFNRAWEIN